jgi:hypothetical protein
MTTYGRATAHDGLTHRILGRSDWAEAKFSLHYLRALCEASVVVNCYRVLKAVAGLAAGCGSFSDYRTWRWHQYSFPSLEIREQTLSDYLSFATVFNFRTLPTISERYFPFRKFGN